MEQASQTDAATTDGIQVGAVADIPTGEARTVSRDLVGTGDDIAVFNDEGAFFALNDTCTHGQASLAEGWIEDCEVECPLHAARFSLRTGEALSMPALTGVKPHRVEVRDGQVWLFPGQAPNAH